MNPYGDVKVRLKFQFGLKWFLLATTLFAVLVGTVGKRAYEWWTQKVALEKRERAILGLEQLGARLYRKDGRHYRKDSVGLVDVRFPPQLWRSAHFEMLAEIQEIESLELSFTGFSDADAPTLFAHPDLKTLRLPFNPTFTDQGLKKVAQLASLERLELAATGVTDEGLREIARLPKLQQLGLERSAVTSRGLIHLRPLQSLRFLGLTFTNVDDTGMEAIADLRGLETIGLSNTQVRGTSLAALARLPKHVA